MSVERRTALSCLAGQRSITSPARSRLEQGQPKCRPPECAGHKDAVSRPRSTAAQSSVVPDFANRYHIGHYNTRFRHGRVAANERDTQRLSQLPESVIEGLDPGSFNRPREGERNQREAGPRAHRCQIAQRARQCPVTDGSGWMEI
jgi:hypothetical protein